MRPTLPVLLLLMAVGCAEFRPLDPEAVREPGTFRPVLGTLPERERLVFSGTWQGVPAGEASLEFRRVGDAYESEAAVTTVGLVSLLYGVTVRASATSGADDLLARAWSYETTGGPGPKRVEVRFHPETGRVLSVIRKGNEVKRVELRAPPGMRDPLGTVYALRRSELAPGMSFRTGLFTERNLYLAESLVVGRETVTVAAGTFDTLLVRTDIRKIVDGVPAEEGRGAAIWLSDDRDRIPVRIQADTKAGRITLKLESREVEK